MSARKKVNQSRPRALACGDALAVAGAVCFNVASDGRPTSARRSSRPPSNSSASVDSPLPPAPSGNYGVGVWPNAPRTRPPSLLGYPHHRLAGRSIGVCSQVLKYANEAILRSTVSSANSGRHGTKFQNSETLAREGTRRWLNYGSDSFALFLVSQRWARSATTVRRSGGPWDARSRPRWLTPSLNPPRAWLCAQFTSARGFRRWP
jgi:hypothetical protein